MKLSIITCTYNSSSYLQETLDSVVSQNLDKADFEHIFVDGESIDSTLTIVQKYSDASGYDTRIISQKKKGIYNAMNVWIKAAKGEYILFLHSDDFLEVNVLNDYFDFIKNTGECDLYYAGRYHYIDAEGAKTLPISRLFYRFGLRKYLLGITTYINQPTVLEKREVFERIWYFDESLKIASDLKHYIEASGKISAKYYPKIVTNFRIHKDSTSTGDRGHLVLSELKQIFSENFHPVLVKIYMYIYKKYFEFKK